MSENFNIEKYREAVARARERLKSKEYAQKRREIGRLVNALTEFTRRIKPIKKEARALIGYFTNCSAYSYASDFNEKSIARALYTAFATELIDAGENVVNVHRTVLRFIENLVNELIRQYQWLSELSPEEFDTLICARASDELGEK